MWSLGAGLETGRKQGKWSILGGLWTEGRKSGRNKEAVLEESPVQESDV